MNRFSRLTTDGAELRRQSQRRLASRESRLSGSTPRTDQRSMTATRPLRQVRLLRQLELDVVDQAIQDNDVDQLRRWINQGYDFSEPAYVGDAALLPDLEFYNLLVAEYGDRYDWAEFPEHIVEDLIAFGNPTAAEEAVERGAPADNVGRGWLHYYAREGDLPAIEAYLEENPDLGTDENMHYLLYYASLYDLPELVPLVNDAYDYDLYKELGTYGPEVLNQALNEGHGRVVDALIGAGYPIEVPEVKLYYGAANFRGDQGVMNVLEKYFTRRTLGLN